MKVLIISPGIPTQKYPLNGVFAFDQAKALNAVGVDVVFLSVDFRSIRKTRRWGFTNGEKDGIKWYNLSIPIGPVKWILHIISKASVCALYRKAFYNDKPDIIHAHFAGGLAYILSKEYDIPYIITEHSSGVNRDDLSDDKINNLTAIYKRAGKVLAVSKALAVRIKQYTGINSIVIPNIIDTSLFLGVRRKEHSGFRLVTTSNLIPLKRTKNIIQVLPEVIKVYEGIHLDIIGEGIMRGKLTDMVKTLRLENKVTFHGQLKREDIAKVYENADCFLLPSSSETFGVAYVEAMAAGLPVIATKCGGPEDFVDESNGILIDVDDLQQLKESIVYMYNHYRNYDSQAIKVSVTSKYSPEVVANKIISVYKEILI